MEEIKKILKQKFPESLEELTLSSSSLKSCIGSFRDVPFLFRPQTREELFEFVKICKEYNCPYSPYGGGRNWGYGSSLPVKDNIVQLDLSRLNKILKMDEELGIVEIECGVTQQILYNFLTKHNSKWSVPTSGAGLNGNIIGNALEKGFGLNPIMNHCAGIISLEVLLPDGQILKSRLAEMGAEKSDVANSWKIGPYLEGLFFQSNFGIVLSAHIDLFPKPKTLDLLLLKSKDEKLSNLIASIQQIRLEYPGHLGGINFSSKGRFEATLYSRVSKDLSLWANFLRKIFQVSFDDWQAIVPIFHYNDKYNISNKISKIPKSHGVHVKLLKDKKIDFLYRISKKVQKFVPKELIDIIEDVRNLKRMITGIPSDFALELAYFGHPHQMKINPAQDGTGIFWFAPILRLKHKDLKIVIETSEKVLNKYQRPNLFSFANFDTKLCEATIPIYYKKDKTEDRELALSAWNEMYHELKKEGIIPYRYSVEHLEYSKIPDGLNDKISSQIKKVFDPNNLISPGRYVD